MVACLNDDLNSISCWAKENRLQLNPKKCSVLPIHNSSIDANDIPPVFIESDQLQFVAKAKCLGYFVNSTLNASDHVNSVVKKIYFVLRNLRLSTDFTPQDTKVKLVQLLIVPHVNYFVNVYSKLDSNTFNKLLMAFNSAVRYAFSLKRLDHVTDKRCAILGCDLVHYFSLRNCLFLFNLTTTRSPLYLFNKLRFSQTNRFTGLLVPKFNFLNSTRLFFISAIRIWNSLPIEIRQTVNRSKFRHLIFNYFKNQS